MKRTLMTVLITVAAVILVLVAAGLLFVRSGVYNVAATDSHARITAWTLETLQEASVSRRAATVGDAPPADSAAIAHGFEHFHAMCVQCHGAPGFDRGELGQGITPTPPRLEEEAAEWSDAELFWITKHGIRLAGMPAFGPTHSDDQIWGIVAFMRRLETMTEEEYAALVRETGAQPAGEHTHAPGTPAHEH